MAASAPGFVEATSAGAGRPLVAFDFDGTLTTHDSFLHFLAWQGRRWLNFRNGLRLVPALLRYLFERDRGALKAAAFRIWIGPITPDALSAAAEAFASASFDRLLRPDALACWATHGAANNERVIVTASPEILVAPFARRLGADRLIGTRLQPIADGRLDGTLQGLNCRGSEK